MLKRLSIAILLLILCTGYSSSSLPIYKEISLCCLAETSSTSLQKGDSGDEVTKLQENLARLKYLSEEYITGNYDDMTEISVFAFQSDHDLTPTGIADEETQQAITGQDASLIASQSAPSVAEPTLTLEPSIKPSMQESNALARAKSYLDYTSFSRTGLIEQLEFEGFDKKSAEYGVDNCGADWNEQAVLKAQSYISYTSFSTSSLIDQLEYEGFTHEQAVYGVEHIDFDQNDQALLKAKSYLDYTAFSFTGLVEQLEYEGFSHSEAVNAANNCGADWNEQAAKKAESYLKYSSFSKSGLIDQLEFEGFTHEQAKYGVKKAGF